MTTAKIVLTGDINLLGVEDPAVPFRRIADTLHAADVVFGNLECCLYVPRERRVMARDDQSGYEGFYADPAAGEALRLAGIHVIGNANNQNYGSEAILASNDHLDRLGIAHAGTGRNQEAARAPIVLERGGLRFGFVQRTSQYWPNNHEAQAYFPGVAALKAYTAYQPPYYKDNKIPPNRPGAPAKVVTWTDREYLESFRQDIAALKAKSDVVVSSHHWGYGQDILDYQVEIAHAAIDAGADIVMGHGPHYGLAVEVYRGKPVYYGLGPFCFIKTNKRAHYGWVGMIAHVEVDRTGVVEAAFSLVRQNADKDVTICALQQEAPEITRLQAQSERFGTAMEVAGDRVLVFART
ncbi:MAG: CapA family protein [Betaproteobacteria bacterium]|nr:CapA family protein [Betaproteobacteria bacterium]